MRTVKIQIPILQALLRKGTQHTSPIMAFFVLSLNIFFLSLPVILIFALICEMNPCVSSAFMNSDSRGPQIAAVKLFTARFLHSADLIPDVQKSFSAQKLSQEVCLQNDIRSFSETPPRDSRVSSVFASNRHSRFSRQLSLSKLWASEKANWAEWSGNVAQIQQRTEHRLRTDMIWGEDFCLEKALRSLLTFFSVWHLSLTSFSCWSRFKCQQQKYCGAKHVYIYFSYVSVIYHLHLSDNPSHWFCCCPFLRVSNRCGRRPSFWERNWPNSTRMKCSILNSSVHPW